MEIVILWILFGIFSSIIASNKNRNALGWFFVGLLFGPFGLLVAFLSPIDIKQPTTIVKVNKKSEYIENLEAVQKLSDLKDKGIITQEEFDVQKSKLLS
ncbi:MAG: SHOCT domain-containing protein [Arcobacteraceae bacterium]|jgi:hypothetical protein|nr:SHOCT domain-containing protein [Arcobacteraceae bacterium]